MLEITSFAAAARVVYWGSQGIEIHPEPKIGVITHENGLKCSKSRVLPTPLESCTGGHRVSKSSRDPKIVGYNPQTRQEMLEITSFADASRVVYQTSQSIEILPEPNIVGYNRRKRPEIAENTSFADAVRVVYRGSQGNKILPGPKNRGL